MAEPGSCQTRTSPMRAMLPGMRRSFIPAKGLDMAGALFPGSPFVLLGHNRTLGWTNTVNRPDLIDVYKLTLDDKRQTVSV